MTTLFETWNVPNTTPTDPLVGDLTWTKLGSTTSWFINSNTLREDLGAGVEKFIRAESDVSTDDNYCQVIVAYGQNDTLFYVCSRFASGADTCYGYLWRPSDGVNQIIKLVAGTASVLQTGSATMASSPVTLRIECNGTTIKGFVNGVEKASVTDSSVTVGKRGGLGSRTQSGATAQFDDVEIGDLGGGGGPILMGQICV